jgi:hypothetical protein
MIKLQLKKAEYFPLREILDSLEYAMRKNDEKEISAEETEMSMEEEEEYERRYGKFPNCFGVSLWD